jgi:hypothetical protein
VPGVSRALAAAVLYLAVVLAWVALRLDPAASPAMTLAWGIAVTAAHLLAGGIAGRWWALLLPFAAVLLAIPFGASDDGGRLVAVRLLAWTPFAALLVGLGVLAVRHVPPLLRTRQV